MKDRITQKRKDLIDEQTKVLDEYKLVESLELCDIIHMYPLEKYGLFNDGFRDAKFFDLYAFNTNTKEKIYLGEKDEVVPQGGIYMFRYFADGSTLIRFNNMKKIGWGQSCSFYEV